MTAPLLLLPHRTRVPEIMSGRQRRMTLPSSPGREDPIYKPATKPVEDPQHGAAFIFVHGLGDNAEGVESMPSITCLRRERSV